MLDLKRADRFLGSFSKLIKLKMCNTEMAVQEEVLYLRSVITPPTDCSSVTDDEQCLFLITDSSCNIEPQC